jgi:hypothetical protein
VEKSPTEKIGLAKTQKTVDRKAKSEWTATKKRLSGGGVACVEGTFLYP